MITIHVSKFIKSHSRIQLLLIYSPTTPKIDVSMKCICSVILQEFRNGTNVVEATRNSYFYGKDSLKEMAEDGLKGLEKITSA